MNKKVFIDGETTGLDVNKGNELVQLAIIVDIDGKTVLEKEIFACPKNLDKVSPEALKIQNRTLEDLKAFPSRQTAFNMLTEALATHIDKFDKTDKLIWVGQNPSFDQGFVRALFDECGDKYFGSWFQQQPVDTIGLAVAAKDAGLLIVPNFKLATLCEALGVTLENAHDALADTRATREVYYKLVGLFKTPEQAGSVLTMKSDVDAPVKTPETANT